MRAAGSTVQVWSSRAAGCLAGSSCRHLIATGACDGDALGGGEAVEAGGVEGDAVGASDGAGVADRAGDGDGTTDVVGAAHPARARESRITATDRDGVGIRGC